MRKNAIIVGAPRSGTSMASYIFAANGYFATEDPETELRRGDEYNPTGYWEAADLIAANVELFQAVGYPHHNTWMFGPITPEQTDRIGAIPVLDHHRKLVDRYNAHAPWLWKDPRLCYCLDYWWPLMDPQTTGVLLLKRNSDHLFQSFLRVGWRKGEADRDEVAERLRAHLACAEGAIRRHHVPHLSLDYEDFGARPMETARKISDFFGLDLRPDDLGFRRALNHSGVQGRLAVHLERLAAALPAGCRSFLKRVTPGAVMNRMFPGRKNHDGKPD